MKWIKTESKFKYNSKPVVRRKAICLTPLGEFKVYESVGGNSFIVHPFIKRGGGLPGYDNGMDEWFGPPKILVKSFEDGIEACETKWLQIKNIIAKS